MPVAIYGATGRTGRMVVSELEREQVECVVGGRRAEALQELASMPHVAAARAADAEDPAALGELLEGCEVLVNCAGPSSMLAEPLLRAALDAGVHYVDAAGEQAFIRSVFERHGPAAEARGVALVPALGFDYAIGDCIARLAATGREPLKELVLAYALSGSSVSGDALDAAAAGGPGPEVVYEDGAWRPARGGVGRFSFRFPEPLGRQTMQRYGSGEVITVPRHTTTSTVTTLITASTWAPHPALTGAMPYLRPLAARLRRSPLRAALGLAARARGGRAGGPPGSGEGARDSGGIGESDGGDAGGAMALERRTARFTIAAIARGEDGSVGRGLVEGVDFYGLTGASLALGARLLQGHGFSGALSAASAFEPARFLDALAERWLRWRLE